MKTFIVLTFISFSAFANTQTLRPEVCYTHGECYQRAGSNTESICFSSCQLNGAEVCFNLPVSKFCDKGGKLYGVCKTEVVDFSVSDPKNQGACVDDSELP